LLAFAVLTVVGFFEVKVFDDKEDESGEKASTRPSDR
jgi:hypothetical protein